MWYNNFIQQLKVQNLSQLGPMALAVQIITYRPQYPLFRVSTVVTVVRGNQANGIDSVQHTHMAEFVTILP